MWYLAQACMALDTDFNELMEIREAVLDIVKDIQNPKTQQEKL